MSMLISDYSIERSIGSLHAQAGKEPDRERLSLATGSEYFEGYQSGLERYLQAPESTGALFGRSLKDEIEHRRKLAIEFDSIAAQIA